MILCHDSPFRFYVREFPTLFVLFYLLCALSYSRPATSQCDWISVYYPLHVTHVTFDSRGRRLFLLSRSDSHN